MRASGAWASLYFVALVVIGTFIVLNLFLAILLGNFEGLEQVTIEEKRRSRMRAKSHQAWVSYSTFAVFCTRLGVPQQTLHNQLPGQASALLQVFVAPHGTLKPNAHVHPARSWRRVTHEPLEQQHSYQGVTRW